MMKNEKWMEMDLKNGWNMDEEWMTVDEIG